MLRMNPHVLDVSEFFSGLDWNRRFQREQMSGPDFWRLISTPHPFISMVLERGYRPPEITYPFRAQTPNGSPGSIPLFLGATLPPLFSDPDEAFEDVRRFLCSLASDTPATQAELLFAWMAERCGRSVWIERSGGSITWMAELSQAFSAARFLHVHRAGEETALSMREHPVFRLAVMLTYGIPLGEPMGVRALGQLGKDADRIARMLASRPKPEPFGRFWADQIVAGFRALRRMDADQYREVAYEDLVADPKATLAEIATFFDLPEPDGPWLQHAAALTASRANPRLSTLTETDRTSLIEACRIGNRLLGRS
jgi:putative sulfotransferase